jgi:hypothetical protein
VADIQPDPWAIATAVGTGVAAVAAGVAAIAAWRSAFLSKHASQVAADAAQATADAAQATIFLHFRQHYASEEMRDDLRELRSWLLWCNERGLDVAIEWEKQWEINPEAYPNVHAKARAVDASRRRVSHFFGAIAELYSQRLLGEPLARVLANYSGSDLVFPVVEHLEKILNPTGYKKSHFDILARLTGYSGPRA